ncbi:hypothetical protein AVEN_32716-1 [Araneus ventricosus]|uniref:Uncharacterized protein n=1 Tax=Araneus ventricosus TaxID=182803 RepID=A0A4Y2MN67_ARAVE|nr:hypothetical protein AVEN_32716-1 [Araneus ventricosus]
MNNDPAIIKAKMLLLKRENITIRAQLEDKHAITETHVRENIIRIERPVGELVPRISEEKTLQSTHGSGRNVIDNDRVLIVKPNEVDNEKFPENKEIITRVIERVNNTARVRGVTKINGGRIKIATADEDEVKALNALLEKEDGVSEKFEIYIPRKIRPPVTLYNVEKELENKDNLLN